MSKKHFSVILFDGSPQIWDEVSEITGLEFKLDIQDLPDCETRERAKRTQYSAHDVVNYVADKTDRGIGVVDVDLFVPELNFVFGLSNPHRNACVVSTARLENERDRIIKEIVHELGHLFGIGHCSKSDCVMHFSNKLSDTDRKGKEFCTTCEDQISL